MNDELAEKLVEKNIKVFRGSETNVLQRFIEASRLGKAEFVQRFCCDNLLFDPDYMKKCYLELDKQDSIVFSNKACSNSAGQSVEIIRRRNCILQIDATEYETEHVFPYFYKLFPKVHNLMCPTNEYFPIDTIEDINRVKASSFM